MGFVARRTAPHEQAIHRLLRPVVRFALRRSVYVQDLIDIVKGVLVEVAEEELLTSGEKTNASRLSIATGMTRRDVSLFFHPGQSNVEPQSFLARVIGQWEHDKRYQKKNGTPRVLSFGTEDSEFSKLVRRISQHVGPSAVVAELTKNGAAAITPEGLKLIRPTIDLTRDEIKAFEIIAKDMRDLIQTLEHNLAHPPTAQNLHFRTEYTNIYRKDVPGVRSWIIKEGRKFHSRVREFLAAHDKDVNPSAHAAEPAGVRIALSSFSYIDEESGTESKN